MGINLANQTGREGKLSAAYAEAAAAYAAAGGKGFRLEPFDFHKQVGLVPDSLLHRFPIVWA